jgi:hypothetical protein
MTAGQIHAVVCSRTRLERTGSGGALIAESPRALMAAPGQPVAGPPAGEDQQRDVSTTTSKSLSPRLPR